MKKYLIIGLSIISSLFLVNKVSADTIEYEYNSFTDYPESNPFVFYSFSDYIVYSKVNQSIINNLESRVKEKYESEYKKKYPYYAIQIHDIRGLNHVSFYFVMLKAIPGNLSDYINITDSYTISDDYLSLVIDYYYEDYSKYKAGEYSSVYSGDYNVSEYIFQSNGTENKYYSPLAYYDSNFDLKFGLDDTYVVKNGNEILFTLNKQDYIPTYKDRFINRTDLNYVEVDLNSYPYIALSLKDYSKTEEFSTINYAKGQYCLTPVYNYGQTEKKDIIEGSKNQRCSLYYDNYTPLKTYILKSDLKNHAIYYLKAYDTTKENKVKIDTSIFNIHYITEEDKDNPILNINGRVYTPKSYDELTDTATKSEEENYADGGTCAVGDFNCTRDILGLNGFSWEDIFSSPIKFLKSIWNSIVQVFNVINMFISLLPLPLQYFLYLSFMLAIILGLIKIIL